MLLINSSVFLLIPIIPCKIQGGKRKDDQDDFENNLPHNLIYAILSFRVLGLLKRKFHLIIIVYE